MQDSELQRLVSDIKAGRCALILGRKFLPSTDKGFKPISVLNSPSVLGIR